MPLVVVDGLLGIDAGGGAAEVVTDAVFHEAVFHMDDGGAVGAGVV